MTSKSRLNPKETGSFKLAQTPKEPNVEVTWSTETSFRRWIWRFLWPIIMFNGLPPRRGFISVRNLFFFFIDMHVICATPPIGFSALILMGANCCEATRNFMYELYRRHHYSHTTWKFLQYKAKEEKQSGMLPFGKVWHFHRNCKTDRTSSRKALWNIWNGSTGEKSVILTMLQIKMQVTPRQTNIMRSNRIPGRARLQTVHHGERVAHLETNDVSWFIPVRTVSNKGHDFRNA